MHDRYQTWSLYLSSYTGCHSNHLKFGGRIRMSSLGNANGETPSLVIMQLPRRSTKLLRTTAGSIYVRQKSDECPSSDSERNFVCPAPSNEDRPCSEAQLPCDHNCKYYTTFRYRYQIKGDDIAYTSATVPLPHREPSTSCWHRWFKFDA